MARKVFFSFAQCKMTMALLTLLLGVVVATDQSAFATPDDEPMGSLENHVGQSRVETPQVVLQLKYDKGELNKIYLAQFRKTKEAWVPTVPARTNLCADLCHAGLGGTACGSTCLDMLPVGLKLALRNANDSGVVFGEPRVAVCPTLCQNHLGEPLCNCSASYAEVVEAAASTGVVWNAVCDTFCLTDGYVLGGCPSCEESTTVSSEVRTIAARILNTQDGWVAWCSVQCQLGHGGAACNCDRSPLQ